MKLSKTLLIAFMSLLSFFSGRVNATPETEFWSRFQRNEEALFDFERDQERTFDRLAAEMHKVHPSLTFEFGPKQGNQREFVISADGIRQAFPKVESLYAAAPKLRKWKVTKFRPRREPFDVEYNGVTVRADDITVLLEPAGQKVGVVVLIPGYTQTNNRAYTGVAYLVLDQALGEYDVETRVGHIAVRAPTPVDGKAVRLLQLPAMFDAQFAKR